MTDSLPAKVSPGQNRHPNVAHFTAVLPRQRPADELVTATSLDGRTAAGRQAIPRGAATPGGLCQDSLDEISRRGCADPPHRTTTDLRAHRFRNFVPEPLRPDP